MCLRICFIGINNFFYGFVLCKIKQCDKVIYQYFIRIMIIPGKNNLRFTLIAQSVVTIEGETIRDIIKSDMESVLRSYKSVIISYEAYLKSY